MVRVRVLRKGWFPGYGMVDVGQTIEMHPQENPEGAAEQGYVEIIGEVKPTPVPQHITKEYSRIAKEINA